MGGTGQRHFDGISLEPRNLHENAHAAKQRSHHHTCTAPTQDLLSKSDASVAPAFFVGDRVVSCMLCCLLFAEIRNFFMRQHDINDDRVIYTILTEHFESNFIIKKGVNLFCSSTLSIDYFFVRRF